MTYEVLIVGGGPAGLSAALALGRARRRVLVCDDAGTRRNALATNLYNFVTRDGTPPLEFREIAIDQLRAYPSVEHRAVRVRAIAGERGAFAAELADGTRVEAARVLVCTGVTDELPALPGFASLWGRAIFQCPYCHGWEHRDERWGFLPLVPNPHLAMFALQIRGWTDRVTVFAGDELLAAPDREKLARAGVVIEPRAVQRLVEAAPGKLAAIEVAGGARVAIDTLFAHPPQRQAEVVRALGLALDGDGNVAVDGMRQTSRPGVYAAGDLTTKQQAAVMAAAAGMHAASAIVVDLMTSA